jgi:chromosome segregation ATPase
VPRTRAIEEQGAEELLSAQQRLASTKLALAASQQDLTSTQAQLALLCHQLHAADRATDRLTADAAVSRQQLDSSNACLQQERQATATARTQAAALAFGLARSQAQLGTARSEYSRVKQQQHSLQQELEQARLEREQAAATILDLCNNARVAAEQALAAERAQHSMAVVTAQTEHVAAQQQLQVLAQELSACTAAMLSHRRAAANAAVITAAVQEQLQDSNQEMQQLQQVAAAALARAHAAERTAATATAGREQVLRQLLAAEADICTLQTQLECSRISQPTSEDDETQSMDCFVQVVLPPADANKPCRDSSTVRSKPSNWATAPAKALTAAAWPVVMGSGQLGESGRAASWGSRALAALRPWGSSSVASDDGVEFGERQRLWQHWR